MGERLMITTETVISCETDYMSDVIEKSCSETGDILFVGTRKKFMEIYGSDVTLEELRPDRKE